jgi:hypothetical protein
LKREWSNSLLAVSSRSAPPSMPSSGSGPFRSSALRTSDGVSPGVTGRDGIESRSEAI